MESCAVAQSSGAHRIELCDNPTDGGTTPSLGFIKAARKILDIELYPIIRPRGGDFLYSHHEFEAMKSDVELCKNLGCDGVVIGMLLPDGNIDRERCWQLVEMAYPMGVTFHRAFDRVKDPFKSLEDIIYIGCERILTSGQKPIAENGAELIKELIHQADERIIIMPGSGIRSGNILSIEQQTGATEFHSSARTHNTSDMQYHNEAMQESLLSVSVDGEEIRKMIQLLHPAG